LRVEVGDTEVREATRRREEERLSRRRGKTDIVKETKRGEER
jgi:hypothetical protein